jgi:hypothetical protein
MSEDEDLIEAEAQRSWNVSDLNYLDDDSSSTNANDQYPLDPLFDDDESDSVPPPLVSPVPRLVDDVAAMQQFFQGSTPMQLILRPVRGCLLVVYGGGDASGEGFGSLLSPLGMPPLYQMGFWSSEISEKSSNWREFHNLLERLHANAVAGRLTGKELWLATDNSTVGLSFFKGRSSSPELDAMVLDLRLIMYRANCLLHVIHITGTRMIAFAVLRRNASQSFASWWSGRHTPSSSISS